MIFEQDMTTESLAGGRKSKKIQRTQENVEYYRYYTQFKSETLFKLIFKLILTNLIDLKQKT